MAIKDRVIESLLALFRSQGFVSEDELLETIVGFNLGLQEIDWVTECLLDKGVIIVVDDANDELWTEKDYDRSQIDYDMLFERVIELEPELAVFVEEVRVIAPPRQREWINLMPQAKSGNQYAYGRLFSMYLKIVVSISVWYHDRYGVSLADTIQDGCLGLITAIDKYDQGKHNVFASYASLWIRQSISRNMIFPRSPLLYFPVHFMSDLISIYDLVSEHLCDACSESEFCPELVRAIEDAVDCSQDSARLYLYYHICEWLSIENEIVAGNEYLFCDENRFEDQMLSDVAAHQLKEQVANVLNVLTERERYVLISRYGLLDDQQKTLEQVGNELGVTRERVRQIEAKAFRRLRYPARSRALKEFLGH